jgi:hypothetical protein
MTAAESLLDLFTTFSNPHHSDFGADGEINAPEPHAVMIRTVVQPIALLVTLSIKAREGAMSRRRAFIL